MRGIQKAVNCLNQVRVGTSLPTQGGSDGEIPNICENGASLLMQGEFVLFAQVSGEGWGTPAYAGKCSHTCTRTRHCRLTPAFAGNMLIQRGFFGLNQEDPRVRGEYYSIAPLPA